LILLVLDLVGLVLLLNGAHLLRLGFPADFAAWQMWAVIAVVLLTLYVMDVYRAEPGADQLNLPLQAYVGTLAALAASAILVYVTGPDAFQSVFGRGVLPIALVVFGFWAAGTRALVRRLAGRVRRTLQWLCLVEEPMRSTFLADVRRHGDVGRMHVLATRDPSPQEGGEEDERIVIQGTIGNLDDVLRRSWDGIVIGPQETLPDAVIAELMDVRLRGVPIMTITDFYERLWLKVPVLHIEDGWFVLARGFDLVHDHVGMRLKRIFDLLAAVVLGVVVAPLLLCAAVAIKIDSRGPVSYRQPRTGRNSRVFTIYKLRSMVDNAEQSGARWSQPNDPRVTRVGRWLRRFRIDEWPQIWNVIRGDMSFIGPRPERPELNRQLEETIPYYNLRHLVAPGITGWAQVMYPYGSSVEDARQKLQYDLYYIKNHSFALDLAIILKTLRIVLKGKGT
jgi:exopolysaccharide biosynthesis polyprenyl glycosylphosphotransferase